MTGVLGQPIDPFTAEIINQGLLSIAKQVEANITRTAYSPLVYAYKDYAVGIVDPDGRLICESGGGIPLFVADSLGIGVRDGIQIHGLDNIHDGDVLISNHAGTLGQHLNNTIMYTPIFTSGNSPRLAGFMAIIVHWVDIGGWAVGSAPPVGTTSIFQEGLQFRSVKFWSRGQPVDDIVRTICLNTRFPEQLFGDINAQLAGCFLGRDMMAAMIDRYSHEAVRAAVEIMWNRAEKVARAAIAAIPDGVYQASSFLDDDGLHRDKPVPIHVIVRIDGERMVVDLSGVADQVEGSINSGRYGGALTAVRLAFKYLCAPSEPANDGLYRPVELEIPDGKFLSASETAAMSKYSTPLPTVIDTILRAMGPAMPGHVAAGHHGNFGVQILEGRHPRTGARFLTYGGATGGWGASAGHDGPGPYKTMAHGDTLDISVEAQEALYPLRVEKYCLKEDTGGAGEFRGGLGTERQVVALAPMNAQLLFERTLCPAWGMLGGADGAVGSIMVSRAGQPDQIINKGLVAIDQGDVLRIVSGGGGGFGDPSMRDPDRVLEDCRLGYVSRTAARDIYLVALDDAGIDRAATARLRVEGASPSPRACNG